MTQIFVITEADTDHNIAVTAASTKEKLIELAVVNYKNALELWTSREDVADLVADFVDQITNTRNYFCPETDSKFSLEEIVLN